MRKTAAGGRGTARPVRRRTERIIGVLGGMGPDATVNYFARLVATTHARCDSDHLRIIIDNNPKVPDRTAAILGAGKSPLAELTRSARALERAGADFIAIPCVTVHFFHAELQRRTRLPVLHIVQETVASLKARRPRPRQIGLLATTGTIRSGLFQEALRGTRTVLHLPPDETQERLVMKAIYAIKAAGPGDAPRRLIREAAEGLLAEGVEAIIAGCTEIPLVLRDGDLPVPVIDPLAVLAEAAIKRAGGRLRHA
jgi:aspartate racemase